MTWFAFKGYNDGKAIDIAGVQEKEAVSLGFHGYATEPQAEANPNSVSFLVSWFVNGIIADYHTAVAQQSQPGGKNADIYNPVTALSAAAEQAKSSLLGLFFGGSPSNWLLRAAEAVLGLILIAVGTARLTSAVPIATAIARKVP